MEACCEVAPLAITANCPWCRTKGTPVGQKTLLNLLKEGQKDFIGEGKYYFCATPHCAIVYYNDQDATTFNKEDLKIRIGIKETTPPVPVCYCFGITEGDIKEEINKTGSSTASKRIQSGIKTGGCACELNNPSGHCCLKEVKKVEEKLIKLRGEKSCRRPN